MLAHLINTSLKVELVPPTPGEIPAAIADISTKVRCSHVKSIWNTDLTSFCLSGGEPSAPELPGMDSASGEGSRGSLFGFYI